MNAIQPIKLSILMLIFCWLPVNANAAVTAFVDQNIISANESFQLTLEVEGDSQNEPDFSPLEKDFSIVSHHNSSNITMINGSVTRKIQWILNLIPKHNNVTKIPAIYVGNQHSNEITITVSQSPTTAKKNTQDMFINVTLSTTEAYVQQQISLTIKIYRRIQISNATLAEPSFEGGEAIVEKQGEDKSYEEMHNGYRYLIIERNYTLFPQNSGQLKLLPILLEVTIATARYSMFDPFAQSGQRKRIQSPLKELTIKPIPANYKGTWLPSKDVQLSEEWPENVTFKVGEPITRTLTLIADGLTSAILPQINQQLPPSIKQYPDKPLLKNQISDSGIIGIRQEKVALIPSQAGAYTLPAISLPWWNINKGQIEYVSLPGKTINVLPLPASAYQATPAMPTAPTPANVSPVQPAQPMIPATVTQVDTGFWPWISAFIAMGWLITLILLVKKIQQTTKPKQINAIPKSTAAALKVIQKACENNNPADAHQALLTWCKTQWSDHPPMNLKEIDAKLNHNLSDYFNALSASLYGQHDNQPWHGQTFWEKFKAELKQQPQSTDNSDVLEPLFKN